MEQENLTIRIGRLIEDYDLGDLTVSRLEELEDAIREANNAYQSNLVEGNFNGGSGLAVSDALYDRAMEILRELAPTSDLASEVWETATGDEEALSGEFLELRNEFPMKSIETIKSLDTNEYKNFKSRLPESYTLLCSLKLNGWGVELYYKNGEFVKGVSRGRSRVKDITEALSQVLERYGLLRIEKLSNVDLCSIRGELILRNDKLEDARAFNKDILHPLSAIQSLLGSKMPKQARQLLSFRAYRYIEHDFHFATRTDMYGYLVELGFTLPLHFQIAECTTDEIDEIVDMSLGELAKRCEDDKYFSDGVVLQVDDAKQYTSMSGNSRVDYGAVALKMGKWKQDFYTGYVQFVIWSQGKNKLTPEAYVATEKNLVKFEVDGVSYTGFYDLKENCPSFEYILPNLIDYVTNHNEMGVPTATGNRVRNVPLYNLNGMLVLGVRANGTMSFRYGGESAVVPCDSLGNLYLETLALNQI